MRAALKRERHAIMSSSSRYAARLISARYIRDAFDMSAHLRDEFAGAQLSAIALSPRAVELR